MTSPDDVENVDPVVQGKLELEFQLFGDVLQVTSVTRLGVFYKLLATKNLSQK